MRADRKHRQKPGRSLWEQNLTRARFLRLAGTGLGLSIIPSSLALWGGALHSQRRHSSQVMDSNP
jgi:hypothetical protein